MLLDAGGVLLDLDYAYLRRLIETRRPAQTTSRPLDSTTLAMHEAEARREIHLRVKDGGRVGEAWRDYFHVILARAGVAAVDQSAMIDSLWEAHQRFGLWTVAIEGAPQAVRELRDRGLRVGVVSNAEGRVERDLDAAGFAGLLETVVDSHVVGVEKPDPTIFAIALKRLDADPATTVYAGDVPAVDVDGARAAGIAAVLVDRHGLYPDLDVPTVRSIGELPALLAGRTGS